MLLQNQTHQNHIMWKNPHKQLLNLLPTNGKFRVNSFLFVIIKQLKLENTSHKLSVESQIQKGEKYSWKTSQHFSSVSPATHQELQTTAERREIIKRRFGEMSICDQEINYLNDMVSEINLLSFLSSSVFNVKNTNKIRSPTSH